MNYQDFCIKQVKSALDLNLPKEKYESIAVKYALKSGLIGLYAETYDFDGTEMKFFRTNFSTRKYRNKRVWMNILGSKKAYDLCQRIEDGEEKDYKKIFYEHITPKSITYESLLNKAAEFKRNDELIDEASIKTILDESKIIILTYEEKTLLDSRENSVFTSKDQLFINQWRIDGQLSETEASDAIKSMHGSCRDNGTAYARIAHLLTNGVELMWGVEPMLSGLELFKKYMNYNNHNLQLFNK